MADGQGPGEEQFVDGGGKRNQGQQGKERPAAVVLRPEGEHVGPRADIREVADGATVQRIAREDHEVGPLPADRGDDGPVPFAAPVNVPVDGDPQRAGWSCRWKHAGGASSFWEEPLPVRFLVGERAASGTEHGKESDKVCAHRQETDTRPGLVVVEVSPVRTTGGERGDAREGEDQESLAKDCSEAHFPLP